MLWSEEVSWLGCWWAVRGVVALSWRALFLALPLASPRGRADMATELELQDMPLDRVEARIAALSDAECAAITGCVPPRAPLLPTHHPSRCACQVQLRGAVERQRLVGCVARRVDAAGEPGAVPQPPHSLVWLLLPCTEPASG